MEYLWVVLAISWLTFVCCDDSRDLAPQDIGDRELSLFSYDGPSNPGGSTTGAGLGACAIDTNLPSHVVDLVMYHLQRIYAVNPAASVRAFKFRQILGVLFPRYTPVVVINSIAAQYYQKYFIIASINGDQVLAWGY